MGTLLLIDGNCIAARAAFALPETITDNNGQPVNAVLGFVSTVLRLLSEYLPQMAAVAFDTGAPSFRHQMLSTYKSGRVPLPESLPKQLESIKFILDAFSIRHYEAPLFEADDILATLATIASHRGETTLIVSTDRDLMQIVKDPLIKLVVPRRGQEGYDLCDEAAVLTRAGVAPSQYVDFAALRGDPSDNILGVRGIGTKTAAKLLGEHGSLERILDHLDKLPSSLSKKLEGEAVRLRRNVELMTLCRDVPLPKESPFNPLIFQWPLISHALARFSLGKLVKRADEVHEIYSARSKAVIINAKSKELAKGHEIGSRLKRICLVACSAEKRSGPVQARELYTSLRFQKARLYAERSYDAWYILSAKHGLVAPDAVLEPYDLSLRSLDEAGCQKWAKDVVDRLLEVSQSGDAITILAEDDYAKPLSGLLRKRGNRVHRPFEGMSALERLQWLNSELSFPNMREDLEEFYALLGSVREAISGPRWLGQCNGRMNWPAKGVYFFLEPREARFNKECLRVTRVGTHAVSRGATSTLWNRLRTHRGLGSRGGAHRSSVFRLHVGSAILSRTSRQDQFTHWGQGMHANKEILAAEASLESEVSAYIGSMEVLYLDVNDAPSPASDRAYIERNAIALLSRTGSTVDPSTESWLGLFSPSLAIRRNGLWNLNYVNGDYDQDFLKVLKYYVEVTLGRIRHNGESVAPSRWKLGEGSQAEQLSLSFAEGDYHE